MSVRTLFAVAGLCLTTALPLSAQTLIPAQSEIGFTVRQMGVPVEGKFKKWDARIVFDPRKPAAGSVHIAIQTSSAGFGSPEFDVEIPKPEWFDSAKFPQAAFDSTAIKASGPGRWDVAGKLTIKGRSRDLVVPVTIAPAGANSVATGSFGIKRLDFKIGEGEWADPSTVADEVQVRFKFTLSGLATH